MVVRCPLLLLSRRRFLLLLLPLSSLVFRLFAEPRPFGAVLGIHRSLECIRIHLGGVKQGHLGEVGDVGPERIGLGILHDQLIEPLELVHECLLEASKLLGGAVLGKHTHKGGHGGRLHPSHGTRHGHGHGHIWHLTISISRYEWQIGNHRGERRTHRHSYIKDFALYNSTLLHILKDIQLSYRITHKYLRTNK